MLIAEGKRPGALAPDAMMGELVAYSNRINTPPSARRSAPAVMTAHPPCGGGRRRSTRTFRRRRRRSARPREDAGHRDRRSHRWHGRRLLIAAVPRPMLATALPFAFVDRDEARLTPRSSGWARSRSRSGQGKKPVMTAPPAASTATPRAVAMASPLDARLQSALPEGSNLARNTVRLTKGQRRSRPCR